MAEPKISIPKEKIAKWCEKWKVVEFSLFGSVLTDKFNENSDIDVMVSFSEDAEWGLFKLVEMGDELEAIFNRSVDLVTKRGIERSPNPLRKKAILESVETIHVSG